MLDLSYIDPKFCSLKSDDNMSPDHVIAIGRIRLTTKVYGKITGRRLNTVTKTREYNRTKKMITFDTSRQPVGRHMVTHFF